MVRTGRSVSLREYLTSKQFQILPISTLEQMSYATNFLTVRDRRILAIEVEPEVDRVLATLTRAAKADPHRYGALLRVARKDRAAMRDRHDFFPHKRSLRDQGIQVVPLNLREITGGYGGAHCMTCVIHRSGA
jgi:arginine deiminase